MVLYTRAAILTVSQVVQSHLASNSAKDKAVVQVTSTMAMVHTINVLSWQTLSAEGENDLRELRLLPKLKNADGKEDKDANQKDAAADQTKEPDKTDKSAPAKPGKKKKSGQKPAPQGNQGADKTNPPKKQ